MRGYTFNELDAFAGALTGASRNTHKNLVQTGTIRPDVKATTGTGDKRRFGFLDIFEAALAGKLMQIPGGMPTASLALALDAIRFETEAGEIFSSPWSTFLNPATRKPGARLWLCLTVQGAPRVVDTAWLKDTLEDVTDALVMLRLDTLLIALEEKTQDCAAPAERAQAWTKRPSASPPDDSTQTLPERDGQQLHEGER